MFGEGVVFFSRHLLCGGVWVRFEHVCVLLFFWAWKVYCAAAARAYIKNQLTGLLFSDANPVGFQVLSEAPACDSYIDLGEDLNHHWYFAD